MPESHGDQAAGLRRLFGHRRVHILTFVAGSAGVGKSVLVANLATCLARLGKEILVLDENARSNVAACFGANACLDLLQVIDREKTLAEVLVEAAPGIRVLPASCAVRKLGKLNRQQQESLVESIVGMEHPADVILVDASLDHPLGFSPLGLAAHETVLVISATGASITEAYSLIKKVSLGYARKSFRILVNMVRDEGEARAIFNNIAQLARSRGLAHLEYAGFVPRDERLRQPLRWAMPVAGLFPDAPAARACQMLANDFLDRAAAVNEDGGVEQFVQQLLHLSQGIDPVAIYA